MYDLDRLAEKTFRDRFRGRLASMRRRRRGSTNLETKLLFLEEDLRILVVATSVLARENTPADPS